MDQGVLVALKCRYKKKLLQRLLIEDENGVSLIDFLKSVNMKVVSELIAESWSEIKPSTLHKSWGKILTTEVQRNEFQGRDGDKDRDGNEDMDRDKEEQEFLLEFQELEKNEISDWLNSDTNDPGFQLMMDDEISDHVLSEVIPDQEEEPQSDGDSNTCPVSHSMAAHV